MALSDKTKQRIESLIGSDKVVGFMKGNRRAPQCGFSASGADARRNLRLHNGGVCSGPGGRQGIKDFTTGRHPQCK